MILGSERQEKYEKSEKAGALKQGEILSNVLQITATMTSGSASSPTLTRRRHPFALIVTPDCDLDWDFKARFNGGSQLKIVPNILLCRVLTASDLARLINTNETKPEKFEKSTIWKKTWQNKDERFHFLERINRAFDLQSDDIPALGIDFKQFFTVPTEDLYMNIDEDQTLRRCTLNSPFKEHVNSRFTYFQSRIALPEEHLYRQSEIKMPAESS